MPRPLVVIFARAPHYGAVKTRLARDIGHREALRFFRHTLDRLVRRMSRDTRFETLLAVTPDTAANELRARFPGVHVVGQGAGDLGLRMIRTMHLAGARPAAIIGSDVPTLTPDDVAHAVRALGRASIALGPAGDGGYWLFGARHPLRLRRNDLAGVRWSGPHALEDTLARLRGAIVLDRLLEDVDDERGYRRLGRGKG